MESRFIIITFLLTITGIYAQEPSPLFIDHNGNVGINSDNPLYRLHVEGTIYSQFLTVSQDISAKSVSTTTLTADSITLTHNLENKQTKYIYAGSTTFYNNFSDVLPVTTLDSHRKNIYYSAAHKALGVPAFKNPDEANYSLYYYFTSKIAAGYETGTDNSWISIGFNINNTFKPVIQNFNNRGGDVGDFDTIRSGLFKASDIGSTHWQSAKWYFALEYGYNTTDIKLIKNVPVKFISVELHYVYVYGEPDIPTIDETYYLSSTFDNNLINP